MKKAEADSENSFFTFMSTRYKINRTHAWTHTHIERDKQMSVDQDILSNGYLKNQLNNYL